VEFQLAWGGDPEDLLVTASGVASGDDLSPLEAALADPRWRPPMHVLLDYREVDMSHLSVSAIEERVALLVDSGHRIGRCHTAVVVTRDLNFGIVRMLQAIAEQRVTYELGVFRSFEQARDWLREARQREDAAAPPSEEAPR
jgi:hypothetical protein